MKSYRALSLAACLLTTLPFIITALVSTYETIPPLSLLLCAAAGAFALFSGYLCGRWIVTAKGKLIYPARITMIFAGAVLLTGSLIATALFGMTSLALIFLPAAILMCFWFGCKTGFGRELLTNTILGAYCLEAALLFPLCRSIEADAQKNTDTVNIEAVEETSVFSIGAAAILLISAAMLIVTAIVLNKRQLLNLSTRTKKSSAELSEATRRFNLKLTLAFSALILFFVIFAGWGGKWLWEGVKLIIKFIISLFVGYDPFDGDDVDNEDPLTPPLPENVGDPTLIYILTVSAVIIGVLLLIKPIRQALQDFFEELSRKLRRRENNDPQKLSYTDFYEVSKVSKPKKNTFRKACRAFERETDPKKKFRLGYKAYLIWLRELGIDLEVSDTVSIQRDKGYNVIGEEIEEQERLFEVYEYLRYFDGDVEEGDCNEMGKMLKMLKEVGK